MEKLVHCDPRLLSLSQKNDITLENPYFESRSSLFEDPDDVKCQDFDPNGLDDDQLGPQRFRELLAHHSAPTSLDVEGRQEAGASDSLPRHFSNSGEFENYKSSFSWFISHQNAMVSEEKNCNANLCRVMLENHGIMCCSIYTVSMLTFMCILDSRCLCSGALGAKSYLCYQRCCPI
jgi:hypothetical protein